MTTTQGALAHKGPAPHDYKPKAAMATSGNFHKAHELLLDLADNDGVFQSTDTTHELMRRMGTTRAAAASSVFAWSDPTDRLGYRRVRLLTPRVSAVTPNEMDWDSIKTSPAPKAEAKVIAVKPPSVKDWAERAFGELPNTNAKGKFYSRIGSRGSFGRRSRRHLILEQLMIFQKDNSNEDGYFELRSAIEALADLGFSAHGVYNTVKQAVNEGGCLVRNRRRRIKPEYVDNFGVTAWAKTVSAAPTPTEPDASIAPPPVEAVEKAVTQAFDFGAAIDAALDTPEMRTLIDEKISKAVMAGLRRQLGVG